ncbi:hypothetical protein HDV01_003627 [Terramyces sp. JEL0728]|nr:hypothetical protein HDV01_003627 [Terramyces sp. JEL0728]
MLEVVKVSFPEYNTFLPPAKSVHIFINGNVTLLSFNGEGYVDDYLEEGQEEEAREKAAQVAAIMPTILDNLKVWIGLSKLELIDNLDVNYDFTRLLIESSITELKITKNWNNHYVQQIFSVIHLTNLKKLTLDDCGVTDDDILVLVRNVEYSRLEKLDLSENRITDIGATALAKSLSNTNLQFLYLNYNSIGLIGAKLLFGTITLKEIEMQPTDISIIDMEYLMIENLAFRTSKYLRLRSTAPRTFEALYRILPTTKLESLGLTVPSNELDNFMKTVCKTNLKNFLFMV